MTQTQGQPAMERRYIVATQILDQMERLVRSVGVLRGEVYLSNPALYTLMVEGPLEDLSRLQAELEACLGSMGVKRLAPPLQNAIDL